MSGLIAEDATGDIETLDSKLASGPMNILHGDFRQRVLTEVHKAHQRETSRMDDL